MRAESTLFCAGDPITKIDRHAGGVLRRFRLDQGVSQYELALLVGISAEELAAYESGEKPLPLSVAFLASLMMHYAIDSLLDDIVFDDLEDL